MDDLRQALREALASYGPLELWFADEHYSVGYLLDKIREGVDNCLFCIFEVSDAHRANVFLELGYALGQGKPCLLLLKQGRKVATDLAGLSRLEYESLADLTRKVRQYVPSVIGKALEGHEPIATLDKRVLALVRLELPLGATLDYAALVRGARSQGVPSAGVDSTLRGLESAGYLTQRDGLWEVTESGAINLPALVEFARDH